MSIPLYRRAIVREKRRKRSAAFLKSIDEACRLFYSNAEIEGKDDLPSVHFLTERGGAPHSHVGFFSEAWPK